MSITINKPIVLATRQTVKFEEVAIRKNQENGELMAILSFVVHDENGDRVDTREYTYTGEDFNTFWAGFNSGKFLYDELVNKEEVDVTVDNKVEQEFINVI